jgi:hypothetical protein
VKVITPWEEDTPLNAIGIPTSFPNDMLATMDRACCNELSPASPSSWHIEGDVGLENKLITRQVVSFNARRSVGTNAFGAQAPRGALRFSRASSWTFFINVCSGLQQISQRSRSSSGMSCLSPLAPLIWTRAQPRLLSASRKQQSQINVVFVPIGVSRFLAFDMMQKAGPFQRKTAAKNPPDQRLQIAGNYLPVCNLINRADSPSA